MGGCRDAGFGVYAKCGHLRRLLKERWAGEHAGVCCTVPCAERCFEILLAKHSCSLFCTEALTRLLYTAYIFLLYAHINCTGQVVSEGILKCPCAWCRA